MLGVSPPARRRTCRPWPWPRRPPPPRLPRPGRRRALRSARSLEGGLVAWGLACGALLGTSALAGSARGDEPPAAGAGVGEPERREKKFLIRPFLALDELSLDLDRDGETLSFAPNTELAAGLRVGYAGFSLSGSVDIESSEDPDIYGRTDYLALQAGRAFRVAERELFVSAFLQYHQGMYLESSEDIVPGSAIVVLPEMTVLSLGLTATYYLNPEFSFDDSFIEFRPRARTVGSWTLRLSGGLMGYDNAGAPVVPEPRRASFGDEGTLAWSSAMYAGAMGGYSVDFRFWGDLCVASSLMLGVTVARERHDIELGRRSGISVAPSALFALALGYSGETFHAGLFAHADTESYTAGDVEQSLTRIAVAVFAGARF